MNTVFPVEVSLLRADGSPAHSGFLQAFTRDVSSGGMCLELKSFGRKTEELLLMPDAQLDLTINTTFAKDPIRALGRIAWARKDEALLPVRYLIGVSYTQIDAKARQRIVEHAQRLRWVPRIAAVIGAAMAVMIIFLVFQEQKLIHENKRLVNRFIESAEKKTAAAKGIYEAERKSSKLDKELSDSQARIAELQEALKVMVAENREQKDQYEKELSDSLFKQKTIEAELDEIKSGRQKLREEYKRLSAETTASESAGLDQMYAWLKSHQNLKTGLVASFEGDAKHEDEAFTYDQALAAQVFLLSGDKDRAKELLEFYASSRATRGWGGYFTAYHTVDGSPTESIVRIGPNVWLGIAALQYDHFTGEKRFIDVAKNIGDWIAGQQDPEGGLMGGRDVSWYSTEHNLDAYAFLNLLYDATKDEKYKRAAEKSLAWIRKYAYTMKGQRLNRGKGDATIATDTFSWAIAAIGPETLKKIDFDPEAIMQFAQEHCEVTVTAKLANGAEESITGFDFAKPQNLGRGGVISTEWTAQMIVSYRVLAQYFKAAGNADKATSYQEKADFYLNELKKLVITSPSSTGQGRGCLPYASQENVDTGHGWRTPAGRRTGSVAGTAYSIFAWNGYNPFRWMSDENSGIMEH
jgi:hypothetical protein